MKCVIFGAGEYDFQLPEHEADMFVIAADAGCVKCAEAGFVPDAVIGDFDSLGFVPEGKAVSVLPVEKDVTDLDAAVSAALEKGADDIRIYGGMGGRPDHTLANISLIARLSGLGIGAALYGAGYTVKAVTSGSLVLHGKPGKTVSVFAWTEKARGVTLKGLKYPLEDHCLTNTFALGVSNSFVGEQAEVSVKEGTLIVMTET